MGTRQGPVVGMWEALAVWALLGLNALAIVVTYTRLPPEELYNTDLGGVAGGLGRALVFVNYPAALIAVALLAIAVARLLASPISPASRRLVVAGAAVAVPLCFVTALPGIVDQRDLDAKPINALPALGVALAFGLTLLAVRFGGLRPRRNWTARDRIVAAVTVAMGILSLPWLLADIGFYVGDLPLAGGLFMSEEVWAGRPDERAVHLGHHHGFDGVLFATAALLLWRQLGAVRPAGLQSALGWVLALMLLYGLVNFANDLWLEQVVKRDWTDARPIPNMLRPEPTQEWAILLLGVVAARLLLFRPTTSQRAAPAQSPVSPATSR